MSSKAKGARRERQAAELYERAGYETYRPQESKFGETDIFGLFDLLAVPTSGGQPVLTQVKSNVAKGIEEWCEDVDGRFGAGVEFQFLVCHDREGWRIIRPYGEPVTVLDEREMDVSMGDGVVEYLRGEADV